MVQGNSTPNLDQIFAQLLFQRDHFHSCSLVSLFKIRPNRPPPFFFAVDGIDNGYDTIFFCGGWTTKCQGKLKFIPNWVQIFKGVVTLYSFSPFQFTIRHTTAPCLIKPVLDQTWKSPFTCGLLVVQGNCTPDQIFAQILFQREHFHSCSLVSPFKISDNNSTQPPTPHFSVHSIK